MALSYEPLEMEIASEQPPARRAALATEFAGFLGILWLAQTDLGDRYAWVVQACGRVVGEGLAMTEAAATGHIAATIYCRSGDGSILMH